MTRIDLTQLTNEIRNIRYHQKLFKVLKKELSALGYWRNHPRGNAEKGYQKMREQKNNS